jgi:hypothetical protein
MNPAARRLLNASPFTRMTVDCLYIDRSPVSTPAYPPASFSFAVSPLDGGTSFDARFQEVSGIQADIAVVSRTRQPPRLWF